MADARKPLGVLQQEWETCTKCDLGVRRAATDGAFVFGEGVRRAVMFIGEGPGKEEESSGRPFVGRSGTILRKVLQKLHFTDHYITNIVACRSCAAATDAGGQPIFRKDFRSKQMMPVIRDEPPLPPHIDACLPRLYEEIYLVDPILIVALGGTAAKTLLQRNVSITDYDVRGKPFHITIPGAGFVASRTEKRAAWARKVGGTLTFPVLPSEVRYVCIPTLHPAYVARQLSDKGPDSPFQQFLGDIRKAIQVYERYMFEIYGVVSSSTADNNHEDLTYQFTEGDPYDDDSQTT